MKILTSWDDGCYEDMRMADLLKKYDLPAIFFIPTNCQLLEKDIKKLSEEFEIGGHTTTHPHDIKLLSRDDAYNEVRDNKEWLEEVTDKDVDWFCYPRGRHSEETRQVVGEAGFKYARTTWVGNIDEYKDNLIIHPTVHVYNARKEYQDEKWLDYAIKHYEFAKNQQNSYYHIWGHSWEVEALNLWDDLEKLFKHIYGNKDNRSNNNSN